MDFIKTEESSSFKNIKENIHFGKEEQETIENCEDEYIKNALILNRRKKYALINILNRIKNCKATIQKQKMEYRQNLINELTNKSKPLTFRLGMPYFKDKEMYSAPHNSDYYKMQQNNELVFQSYCSPRPWTMYDKTKLAIAVYKSICNERIDDIKKQINDLKNDDDNNDEIETLHTELKHLENKALVFRIAQKWLHAKVLTSDELKWYKNELKEKINFLEKQICNNYKDNLKEKLTEIKQELNESESRQCIIKVVASWSKGCDWLLISCNEVLRHSDTECKFMWENYIDPKINKKPWTEHDNNKLNEIAQRKHNLQNWDLIASELGINKSPYQCCIHFFSKLYDNYRKSPWSVDEEAYLMTLIDLFRTGCYIPWAKIVKFFGERSRNQIYKHYLSCMQSDIKKGPFSLSEDILLLAIIKYYNNIKKAKYFFSNRTLTQLRDRIKAMRSNYRDWTFEDDIKILKHVEKFGESNWKFVDLDRCPNIIRHRYMILKQWIMEHPNENILNVPRRQKTLSSRKQHLENKFIVDNVVKHLLSQIEQGDSPEKVLNLEYIETLLSVNATTKRKAIVRQVKKKDEPTISSVINEFFKYSYKPKGRQKTNFIFDTNGTEQVITILNILGASLNIPDINELQNNPLLDEVDLKILDDLKRSEKVAAEPQPGPSGQHQQLRVALINQLLKDSKINAGHQSGSLKQQNVTENQQNVAENQQNVAEYQQDVAESQQNVGENQQNIKMSSIDLSNSKAGLSFSSATSSKDVVSYLPPNPTTLIGFRGLMLFTSDLKNYSSNNYLINRFLPSDSQIDVPQTGTKYTIKLFNQQNNLIKDKANVLDERELFKKRLRSLFKWPALMSLPENQPEKNIFIHNNKTNEDENKTNEVKKQSGRPRKISAKVTRMVEGKKRKLSNNNKSSDDRSCDKKPKVD